MPNWTSDFRRTFKFFLQVVFVIFAATPLVQPVYAQTVTTQTSQADTANNQLPPSERIGKWQGELDSISQAISRQGVTETQLIEFGNRANEIEIDINQLVVELQPEANQIQQQIEALGPVPKEGEPPESDEVTAKREKINVNFAEVDGFLKEAKVLAKNAQQLAASILEKRRGRFLNHLSKRELSILNPSLWWEFANGFDRFGLGLKLLIGESSSVVTTRIWANKIVLTWLFGGMAILFAAYFVLRDKLQKALERILKSNRTKEQKKAIVPLLVYLRVGFIRSLLIATIYWLVHTSEVLTDKLDQLYFAATWLASYTISLVSVGLVYLRPNNSSQRLFNLSDSVARQVFLLGIIGITCFSAIYLINVLASILYLPLNVSIGLMAIGSLVIILSVIRMLLSVAKARAAHANFESLNKGLFNWIYLRAVFWVAALAASAGLIFGYISFAEFMAIQIIIAAHVFGLLWLALTAIEYYKQKLATVRSKPAREIALTTGMDASTVRQFSVLFFGILKVVIVIFGLMALLAQWGVRTSDWLQWTRGAYFGFQVGGLTISISTILLAILLFLIGYLLTRTIRTWFETQYLPTTKLDIGLRNSIATIIGYCGIVLALALAIGAAGFDLSNLAIVAGALSLGIGFGLQSIVNNFVSGLILLAERPMKAGDWVITTGGEGTVRRISVRSTEIETFDQAVIIVPNSTLISDPVTNWTHRNKRGRIIITIGVDYSADPELVRDILLRIARENQQIATDPEPVVYFMDFGADALIFDLRCYLSDIEYCVSVKSELRFALLTSLRQANINIPFPQRDLHIKSGLEALAPRERVEEIRREEQTEDIQAEDIEIPEQTRLHKSRDT